jgi:signal transduction histidine kinase
LTEALAVKDEFLGLVSHELKTPITTILGNAQIMRRAASILTEDDRAAAMEDIAHEAERLHTIVDNLLVLARAESPQELEFEPVMLHRIVGGCVEEFARRHPGRTVEFHNGSEAFVLGDEVYIQQIVHNLLSNAAKYSPPSAPIDVEIDRAGVLARVHVCDRGPGIDDGERGRIFDTFYRSPATAQLASGVGVGLAVCKRLAEAMGGEMWATNRAGGGADIGFGLVEVSVEEE